MRSQLFHILLFLVVIVLVALYLYSEKIREGLQIPDSSSNIPINSDPSIKVLTTQEILTVQTNTVLAIIYVIMDVLENKVPFYNSDMKMVFCSKTGVISKTCGSPQNSETRPPLACSINDHLLNSIVEETFLDPLPRMNEPNKNYNKLQVNYIKKLKNTFSVLLKDTIKTKYNQTYDICKDCDVVYKSACDQVKLTDKPYYNETDFQTALNNIIKEIGTDSLKTVGDLANYIQTIEKQVLSVFVSEFFPTNTFGYDRLIYYNYFLSVNDEIFRSIYNMFSSVNMTNYIDTTIPKDIVLGSTPEYIVEKGDPGTIFSYPLQQDYHSDPTIDKISPRSYCKSGQFHSITNPQNGLGDVIHYVCD